MGRGQQRDGEVLEDVRCGARDRQQVVPPSVLDEAEEQEREEQAVGDREDQVDLYLGPGVEGPCARVEPIERFEQVGGLLGRYHCLVSSSSRPPNRVSRH